MADKLAEDIGLSDAKKLPPVAEGDDSLKDSASEFFIQKRKDFRIQTSSQKDVVDGRYQIQSNKPIDSLSSSFADAYEVVDQKEKDNKALYALILDKRYPIRLIEINKLLDRYQDGFCNVLAACLTRLSFKEGNHYVVVVEKPQGITLFKFLSENGPQTEEFVVTKIMTPVNAVLSFLHKRGVAHGGINLDTIYIDQSNKIYVKECVSEICGFSQKMIYETLNRASCLPAAKGADEPKADYYALGVMANLLLLGGNPVYKLSREDTLQMKYMQGTYSMLSKGLQLSPHMLDMLRGTINDYTSEVWDSTQMDEWCKGRRFNLLPQAQRSQATRSLEFNGRNYLNLKHLANDMFLYWDEAKKFVYKDRLTKWVERSVQDSDLSERLMMVKARAGKQVYAEGFESADLLVAETILLLDPNGPLRFKNFSSLLGGIGPLLAYAYAYDKNEVKHIIKCILNFGVVFDWSTISTSLGEARHQQQLFALQRCADMIGKKGYGFGLERCLYELNPTLCCQSSQVFNEAMFTVPHLLEYLDTSSQIKGDLIDKQIAAFVASRVELPSAIRVKSLEKFPDLAEHIHIQSLALYALAQQHADIKKLSGLADKLQTRLEEIIELFHSKKIREEIYQNIKNPVKQGALVQILKVVTNASYVLRDKVGFKKAKESYYEKTQQILSLNNKRAIANVGYRYGLQLALMLAFLVATLTTLTLFMKIF